MHFDELVFNDTRTEFDIDYFFFSFKEYINIKKLSNNWIFCFLCVITKFCIRVMNMNFNGINNLTKDGNGETWRHNIQIFKAVWNLRLQNMDLTMYDSAGI